MQKFILSLLVLCGLPLIIGCGNDNEQPNKKVHFDDTLQQIAYEYPLVCEMHYARERGIPVEKGSRRIPVIPRTWSGKWTNTYRSLHDKTDSFRILSIAVAGDTIDSRKELFKNFHAESTRLTGLELIGVTPILCALESLQATGIDSTGKQTDISVSSYLNVRQTLNESIEQKASGAIRWKFCETAQSEMFGDFVRVTDFYRSKDEMLPNFKLLVPAGACRKFSRLHLRLTLANRQSLNFETPMPSAQK